MESIPSIIVGAIGLVYFIGLLCMGVSFFTEKDNEPILYVSKKTRTPSVTFTNFDDDDYASVIIRDDFELPDEL